MIYRGLGCDNAHRKAMLREMTTQLTINGRIVATEARAEGIHKTARRMATLGKCGNLSARKQAVAFVCNRITDAE